MRIKYLDVLKILACIGVIIIHVSMFNIKNKLVTITIYSIFNFYSSIARYAVPIFVMISGVFLLDPKKNITIKKIYTKYIPKILICYIIWSLIYGIIYKNISFESFLKGNYHLWYLVMLIGLYIVTPFLRCITKDIVITKYYIIIGIIFAFLIPNLFSILKLIPCLDSFEKNLYQLNHRMFFGYTVCYPVYYLLGYYLYNIKVSKIKEHLIYILGIIGIIITIFLSHTTTIHSHQVVETFYDLSNIAILLESIALFIFFKQHISDKQNIKITSITKYTFGIYLIHPIILSILPFDTMSFNALLSVPVITIIVFILSYIVSFILNHIPIIKKWLV